ncbi:MAG: hypothetical protein KA277_01925 [Fusobacteriaceae bacterium]|nr:hypothetical protein [Fusobacteriaceae bacterium]MBP6466765.1 hypothetical protein [Fusobacteriaceae bacterium]MBP9595622.1 hypothetical protein [Fusobacteriaceae bacterium]MBU9917091.1 hypothetical protein [Fusobacteriaceae bacterium]
MEKIILIIFFFVSLLILVILVYFNWGSAEVKTLLLKMSIIGIISAIVSIYITLKEEKIEKNYFTGLLIYKNSNFLDESLGSSNFVGLYSNQYFHEFNKKNLDYDSLQNIYFDFLLVALTNELSNRFNLGWDYKNGNFNPLNYDYSKVNYVQNYDTLKKKSKLSFKEIKQYINTNIFKLQCFTQFEGDDFGISLPPNSKIKISSQDGFTYNISIYDNKFYNLNIELRKMDGYFGNSRNYLGENKMLLTYGISIKANFNKFLSGNINMPKYKNFVNNISNYIEDSYDYKYSIENYKKKEEVIKILGKTF